ncbi:MAG: hypothetical protein AB1921_18360 [Thermodesulfobacteriota bacterium]
MTRTRYGLRGSDAVESLLSAIFSLGGIGYAALGSGQEVLMRTAPGLETGTTAETNFYEELLVNPTLLGLASQRALLDCGGLNYIAIGYGDFTQLILPIQGGHLSVGVSRKANPGELAARIRPIVMRCGLDRKPPAPWLTS